MNDKIVVLIPGGLKPCHGGHLNMIRKCAESEDVDHVQVLIGKLKRDMITGDMAVDITRYLCRNMKKVDITYADPLSPVLMAWEIARNSTYGKFAMVSSSKDNDMDKVDRFINTAQHGPNVQIVRMDVDTSPITYTGRGDSNDGKPISSTVLRSDILSQNFNRFATNYPNVPIMDIMHVWNMINSSVKPVLNKHTTHIEDLLFSNGPATLDACAESIKYLIKNIGRNGNQFTVKYDGSPSILCWKKFKNLPDNGVATKSVFNEEPKTYSCDADLKNEPREDLREKLRVLLNTLRSMNIPDNEMWQGDFMYGPGDMVGHFDGDISDKPILRFQPNVIRYSVTPDHPHYYNILKSSLGIVWHTRYTYDKWSTINVTPDLMVDGMTIDKMFCLDHTVEITDGDKLKLMMIKMMAEEVMSNIGKLANDKNYLKMISDKVIPTVITRFCNTIVRGYNPEYDPDSFSKQFVKYATDFEIPHTKSNSTPAFYAAKERLNTITDSMESIVTMKLTMDMIREMKDIVISVLSRKNKLKTHVIKKSDNSEIEVSGEGFVMEYPYGIVKLVDRKEFSKYNFDNDISRGWNKEKRL